MKERKAQKPSKLNSYPDVKLWRVGSRVPLNVYEGDRPVCQCHNSQDAELIVLAMNALAAALEERQRKERRATVAKSATVRGGRGKKGEQG